MNPPSPVDWTEVNQRYLAAEFARLKAQLSGEGTAATRQAVDEARAALPAPAAVDQLAATFALSSFERDLLLLCAGVEMDSELAACCAAAGMAGRPFVTFGLALGTLADPHWSALTPVRPLRLWRLVEIKDEQAVVASRLSLDERVLHYLAGVSYLDARLRPLLRAHEQPAAMTDSHARVADAAVAALEQWHGSTPVLQLTGDDTPGQKDVAAAVTGRLGLQLHVVRTADIPAGAHELDAFAVLWRREAALLASALLIESDSDAPHTSLPVRLADHIGGLVFFASREPVPVDRPTLRSLSTSPMPRNGSSGGSRPSALPRRP
jgi:hypothetical protein